MYYIVMHVVSILALIDKPGVFSCMLGPGAVSGGVMLQFDLPSYPQITRASQTRGGVWSLPQELLGKGSKRK